jgi:hypothetical protein
MHRQLLRRADADPHLAASHGQHGDGDIVSDHHGLPNPPRQNEHVASMHPVPGAFLPKFRSPRRDVLKIAVAVLIVCGTAQKIKAMQLWLICSALSNSERTE